MKSKVKRELISWLEQISRNTFAGNSIYVYNIHCMYRRDHSLSHLSLLDMWYINFEFLERNVECLNYGMSFVHITSFFSMFWCVITAGNI